MIDISVGCDGRTPVPQLIDQACTAEAARCLTSVDVLCSPRVAAAESPTLIAWPHEAPWPALASRARSCACPPWLTSARPAMVPVPRATRCGSPLPAGRSRSRACTRGTTPEGRDGEARPGRA